MNVCPVLGLVLLLVAGSSALAAIPTPRDRADLEAATRLQVYLDRAKFGPGKIDGRYGTFTRQALELYRQSRGEKSDEPTAKDAAPDVAGLDLTSVDPVFISYTITQEDVEMVGEMPKLLREQAELKWMPYTTLGEAIAEMFHCDEDFLAELNSDQAKSLKVGDTITVPNVQPFDLKAVKKADTKRSAKPDSEEPKETGESPSDDDPKSDDTAAADRPVAAAIHISIKTNMLEVRAGEKITAAFPVTVGSDETGTPVGQWSVRGVARLPDFRYDEKMLNEGERSSNFFVLPPGPNNLVGVLWIALNKKGIGIHGTNSPDGIGRSASHGCIRLANWDVVRVAEMVAAGTRVTIE